MGKKNSSGDEILAHLKYEAWINCANAIVNVSSEIVSKPYVSTEFTSTDSYNISAYSGLAILVDDGEKFSQKYRKKGVEIDFIQEVEDQKKSDQKKLQAGESLSIIFLIGTIVVLAIAL